MFPRERNLYGVSQPRGVKDRHSKVFTSKGPRDRRMRLSIETAIKFYDLQDRLGLDRPSKTVEWLLQQSQPAVHELSQSSSAAKVCQSSSLLSPTNPMNNTNEGTDFLEKFTSSKDKRESSSSSRYSGSKTVVLTRGKRGKAITNPIVRKDCRTKARQRARERTILKGSAKQNLKVLPQQQLSESFFLQGPLDSSSCLSYSHIQKAFQFSSEAGVGTIKPNVGNSPEHSTAMQKTGFQQDFISATGFSMQDQVNCLEFSSDGEFFCNQEILQDLQELDSADICLWPFVEQPQAWKHYSV